MGILFIQTDEPGQITQPSVRRVQIISSDNLATVTAAGYLNKSSLQGFVIYNTDTIDMWYGATGSVGQTITSPGTYEKFTPTISNGVITLTQWANPGDVLLPVVSGDVAIFNGTSGQIKDSGVAFSNTSDTVASLFHGTATAGDFVTVNNANKTIQDSGAAPSAAAQPFVVMSPGSLTSGHLIKLNDANGTIADQGFAMKSVAGAAIAGGSATNSVSDAFCTSASNVIGNFNTQANAASVLKITPGNGSFSVVSSADPGASTFNYIITK